MTDARDYSTTLFLPQTEFPMRAGFRKRSRSSWPAGKNSISTPACVRPPKAAPSSSCMTDRRTANGNNHIGTALNKILERCG